MCADQNPSMLGLEEDLKTMRLESCSELLLCSSLQGSTSSFALLHTPYFSHSEGMGKAEPLGLTSRPTKSCTPSLCRAPGSWVAAVGEPCPHGMP